MLNGVIRFALRYRLLVVVLSLAALGYGGYLTATLSIDVFPDLDRPRVVVMAECPGLAPEEVEALVTFPLESALLGATGVQAVRSQSGPGLSVIYVEFGWNTDIFIARQTVQERLSATAASLPEDVKPQMGPISSLMGQVMLIGVHPRPGPGGGELAPVGKSGLLAERLGEKEFKFWKPGDRDNFDTWQEVVVEKPREIVFPTAEQQGLTVRTLADWVIRPRLLKIAGTAQVVVMGGGRKQYQILVDPHKLLSHDVTLDQVVAAGRRNNLNASGGFDVRGDEERPVRILGRLGPESEQVLKQLRELPVKPSKHRTVQLHQVARVVEGPQIKRGDAGVNGFPAVVMAVAKQPHTDTRALTDQIKTALREIEPSLPVEVTVNTELFQMKRFIDTGVWNVGEALMIGAVLVLIILFLFLLNVRTTFISLTAIPLSLVLTGLVFRLTGWLTGTELSINVMTLGGIAIAMGELVDDAIVDVENIYRRLRENAGLPNPKPVLQVIYEASVEVRTAIVFGTAMVILVFIPLFALSGIEGRLFTPLGIAYITSILASLLVSLTVTPVLSYFLLGREKTAGASPAARPDQETDERRGLSPSSPTHGHDDSPLLQWLKWLAAPLVRFSMGHAGSILAVSWLMVVACVVVLAFLGKSFLPEFDEGSIQVNLTLPPNSSLQASNEICRIADLQFRELQRSATHPNGLILNFVRRTGRAELDEHVEPVSNTEYILSMNPDSGRNREEAIKQIQTTLKEALPGVDVEVEQPLSHLISHMLSGVTAQIAIKIHGDDLDTLRQTAERIKTAISGVQGLTTPVIEAQQMSTELHVRLRPEQLAHYGLDRTAVAEFVQTGLRGETVSEVLEGQRRFDLVVMLDEPYRGDVFNLGRLQLELPGERGHVALRELADIELGAGPNKVSRENARRLIVIRCNTQGRDLAGVVGDIRKTVEAKVKLPEGYFVEYGGQFESQQRATTLITVLALASVVGMFVVLFMLYPSVRIVLQILNALPTAFIGGVLALVLTGQTLTVASMVGFISLGGIAARNGILLVSHYFHLMKHEGEGFTPEMVVRGSLERLAPVLMTALTAGIALMPLVWAGHEPGREILYPVATVILGGLITSTLCEFLIHPGIFWRFSGKDALRLAKAREDEAAMVADDESE